MKISELQEKLRKIKKKGGDAEIDMLLDKDVYSAIDLAYCRGRVFIVSELNTGNIRKDVKEAVEVYRG